MKSGILRLAQIARKPRRRIVGLMSGTSLDGLDIALCAIRGAGLKTRVRVEAFRTVPYPEDFKRAIRQVFAQRQVDFQHLTLLNVQIAEVHAALVLEALRDWAAPPDSVDILASHGQTVFHAPRIFHGLPDWPNASLQIGDGDHLARRTGLITISDFRQKHLAAGGEGAPLALYGDYFLFSKPGEDRFLLNIGGIANYTYLPADGDPAKVAATDTGPGNTLLDAFARDLFQVPFDEDGRLAASGVVLPGFLKKLHTADFLHRPAPKTTGPETFSLAWAKSLLASGPEKGSGDPRNILSTLSQFTADTIATAIRQRPLLGQRATVFVSGGGACNPDMMQRLRRALPTYRVTTIDRLGIPAAAKEAVLFAVLANETLAGAAAPDTILGGIPLVSMGKISLPD
jgi:anhydro-N-acetylmuramic acid kinase